MPENQNEPVPSDFINPQYVEGLRSASPQLEGAPVPAPVGRRIEMPHKAELLQALAIYKKWGPWNGKIKQKMEKMAALFEMFKRVLNLPTLRLRFEIPFHYRDWTDSGTSNFNPRENVITMKGKLSLITFMHEFAHAYSFNTHRTRRNPLNFQSLVEEEQYAHDWSETLFNEAFPEKWAQLLASAPDANGMRMLTRPRPERPAQEEPVQGGRAAMSEEQLRQELVGQLEPKPMPQQGRQHALSELDEQNNPEERLTS